jgi:DNA (cytosine-5)-methyltransferase 1
MSQQAMFDKNLIDFSDDDWVSKKLKHPKRTINVGTLFSGIGAIEYSFKRLNLKEVVIDNLPFKNREKYFKYHYQNILKKI